MKDVRTDPIAQAGFAGALALAAGSGAYGSIVVVPVPANLPALAAPGTAGPLNWDVNGDLINDFNFTYRNPQTASPNTGVLWQANMNIPLGTNATNSVVGYTGPFIQYANNLAAGTVIGPGSTFRPTGTSTQAQLGSLYRSGGVETLYGAFTPGAANPGGGHPGAPRGFVG